MDESGRVSVGGESHAPAIPGALASVASLEAEVDGSRFDDIRLRVRPKNSQGEVVAGLTGGDFVVEEEGQRRLHLLRSNEAAPSVFFLVDQSLSMPSTYRGREGKAFFEGLEKKIADTLGARVETRFTSSNIWTHLARAADDAPSLIVYATDGHVNDKPTPAILRSLKQGPPAIMVDVSGQGAERLEQVAAAANGQRIPVADAEGFERAVLEAAKDAPPRGYDIRYAAVAESPDTRTVTIATRDGKHRQTLTYDVPVEPERAVGQRILGLYLEVKDEHRSGITPLVGLPYRGRPTEAEQRRAAAEARAGLYGQTLISFEAGMPSRTQLVDDFLTAAITQRQLSAAMGTDRLDDVLGGAALKAFPLELATLQGPLGSTYASEAVAYPEVLRAVAITTHPTADGRVHRSVDLIPVMKWRSLAPTATQAFLHTLTATPSWRRTRAKLPRAPWRSSAVRRSSGCTARSIPWEMTSTRS